MLAAEGIERGQRLLAGLDDQGIKVYPEGGPSGSPSEEPRGLTMSASQQFIDDWQTLGDADA
jgi:hypothetical protein